VDTRRVSLSWVSLAVLIVLVCVLGVLQYRWIGEISEIERRKLHDTLQSSLGEVSRDFDSELGAASFALAATNAEVDENGREPAYSSRYTRWRESTRHPKLFNRIALAWEEQDGITLRMLNPETGAFARAEWPESWRSVKSLIHARLRRGPGGPPESIRSFMETSVIDLPRFGGPGGGPGERDWLLLEVDAPYVAATILPPLLARHFGRNYTTDFQIDVVSRANSNITIFRSGAQRERAAAQPAASVTLFDVIPQLRPGGLGFGGPRHGPDERRKGPPGRPGPDRGDRPRFEGRGFPGGGRWQMSISLNGGPLETVVTRARQRNLAISAAILLLMLITAAALVRFSRQAQRLAAIEMEFVANVSHELRTPLTVIRTAAFNLRGRLANNPSQVERYGTLIRQESEKLTAIVEQVLQFASAKRGRVLHERKPVSVASLIEDSLKSSRGILEEAVCDVEKEIEPGLPPVLGDSMALQHALQNLITNAIKYGMNGTRWIGVFARSIAGPAGSMIEIRVADRGVGIPADEQQHIFDAFFRGKRAVSDQIHGTGLGLNLVKQIVEAHGGDVEVQSEAGAGTTFIVRIPVYQTDQKNELTNSTR
jgi:signal transduction histidine kinase